MGLDFGDDRFAADIYRASRSLVGRGGTPEREDTSILDLWRACRAQAFAIIREGGERAAMQALPDRATDALPYYEKLFGLTPEPGETDEARQAEAAARYTLEVRSTIRDLSTSLTGIDGRFRVTATDVTQEMTTVHGRAFDDFESAEPYVEAGEDIPYRRSTDYPNYSSEFIADVVLELGDGVLPTADERRKIARAAALLHAVLPGHNDISITTHRGFTLDVSRLDLTSLGYDS